MGEITINPVRKLFVRVGAKRVSDKAAIELARVIEEKTKLVATEAEKLSVHAGRRTVMKRDIRLAKKIMED